jgi:general secretion pathway protein G
MKGSARIAGIGRLRGFTLLELMIVVMIIAILVGIAAPVYRSHVVRAREAVLKEDLYSLRQAIDQYTQDKNKAPQGLEDLVSAGYLKAIPKDPITNSTESWQLVQEDVNETLDQTQTGITDVHSGSNETSSEGTAYSTW